MTKGIGFLLFAALSFSFSTVFGKFITLQSEISAFEITFFRFLLGLFIMLVYVAIQKKSLRPHKRHYVLLRAVSNFGVVIFLFLGVQSTTITKANMLNMTYPMFVFVIAPFINREKAKFFNYLFLLITMVGVYLITFPDFSRVNFGDLYALVSGIFGGFAVSILRESRKYDETYLIMFYLNAIGSVMSLIIIAPSFILPGPKMMVYLILSGLTGLSGQLFSTLGFRYLDAPTGALITASRIMFAGSLGVSIFADPLTLKILLGGGCIVLSLVGVSGVIDVRSSRLNVLKGR
jgi:drug/metabolite transporter (DMT)-like permease